jgi:ABC-type antimicrobial peptide transport system permease subunit
MSHTVARHTNEIGIRIALGAPRAAILRLVVGDTLRVALAGAIVGLLLVACGSRVAQRFLFGISAMDPTALAAATALVIATALLAGYLPARRAATVDPTVALRSE